MPGPTREIVLSTLNARYSHASLGLRSLLANLGDELRPRAALAEFTIKERPDAICEQLLAFEPRVVGLGVYIWNVSQTTAVVRALKRRRPELTVVLGGPEVSHETDRQDIVAAADFVVCGEGEVSFRELCRRVLTGQPPTEKILTGVLPELRTIALPYSLYTDKDLRERVVYVEASRGCPYKCEFCLSSLDKAVRDVPLERFLTEMEALLDRGVTCFKFIDRTFNLKTSSSCAILEFFLARYRPGMFLHFELVPDRLPEQVRALAARFPKGALQFEVGIQTFQEEVSRRISRRQDNAKVEENLRFLRQNTGVHIHADLIVGLPGESLHSFADGFDRLVGLGPQEIQVGLLKRLRGTPIVRHDVEWKMVYSADPPYELLSNRDLDAATIARLTRFAKFWDLVHNSGNFPQTVRHILALQPSAFSAFLDLSDWLFGQVGRTHAIALDELASLLMRFLENRGQPANLAGPMILADYLRPGGRRVPEPFRPFAPRRGKRERLAGLPPRQARHAARQLPEDAGGKSPSATGRAQT